MGRRTVASQSWQLKSSARSAVTLTAQPEDSSPICRVCLLSGRQSATFCRTASSRFIAFSSGSDGMVGAVERQGGRLAVNERMQVHGPAPDELDVGQGLGGVVQSQVNAVVLVFEKQFTAVAVIAVHHVNPRPAVVSQAVQQSLLDLLKFARLYDILSALFLEGEGKHLVFATKIRGQERVDKGNIVVN